MKDIKALVNGILDAVIPPEKKDIPPLFNSWRDVAGDDCAAHSRIIDYMEGILVIEADHPGWIQIILTRRKRILSALKRKFPGQRIYSVRIVLAGSVTQAARAEGPFRTGTSASAHPTDAADTVSPDRRGFADLLKRLGKEIEERAEERKKGVG